ncbi:hypothetical protein OBBRIDRAFT_834028 [Obba rivulosa]|uniref:LysM domain-containing protein n=1 Tax=Obba rivulosa TaxID=1052685 RepID=A0A8E2AYY6_9APHY|nr:hypothetical protein OBBRIDRAFT_834028 [Obba rivulosa]
MPFGRTVVDGIDVDADPTLVWRSEFPAERSTTSFTSAVKPHETRPAYRRRGSDGSTRRSRTDHDPCQDDSRSRSQTLQSGTCMNHHPLAGRRDSASAHTRSPSSAHDTRPHLKRLLSDSTPVPGDTAISLDPPDHRPMPPPAREEEKAVLVHEILPTDSLPGVALKYGIKLADLRKANQLWASDSIHLRKVLYIPLELARPTKQFSPDVLAAAAPGAGDLGTPGTSAAGSSGRDASNDSRDKFTILRVPVSQLTFFPRPSRSASSLQASASRHRTLPRFSTSPYSQPNLIEFTSSEPSAASSTSALSSSLPPASTPPSYLLHTRSRTQPFSIPTSPAGRLVSSVSEALIARLSLDSTSGKASSSSDEQDGGHEMVDVSTASSSTQTETTAWSHGRFASTPAVGNDVRDYGYAVSSDHIPLTPSRSNSFRTPKIPLHPSPSRSSSLKPIGYSRPLSSSQSQGSIRTAQLEPSPVMQLPLTSRKPKPREGSEGALAFGCASSTT